MARIGLVDGIVILYLGCLAALVGGVVKLNPSGVKQTGSSGDAPIGQL